MRAQDILRGAESADDLGRDFGAGLTEREVRHLIDTEWAITAEDVLWRRTKLGLFMSAEEASALEAFMKEATGHAAHAA